MGESTHGEAGGGCGQGARSAGRGSRASVFDRAWLVENGLGALHPVLRTARRVVVGVIGGTVLAIGVAMLVLPGPAIVVIPIGLGILGLEFAFARRWLRRLRESVTFRNGESRTPTDPRDDRAS